VIRTVFAASAILLLAACAPDPGGMTAANVTPVAASSPLAHGIAVGSVVGGDSKDIRFSVDIANEDVKTAIQQSLWGSGLGATGDVRYVLAVQLNLNNVVNGTSATAQLSMHYTLIQSPSGRTVFETTIDSRADGDGLSARNQAEELAVRDNIAQLVARLEQWHP
jgi:hypothetical protein